LAGITSSCQFFENCSKLLTLNPKFQGLMDATLEVEQGQTTQDRATQKTKSVYTGTRNGVMVSVTVDGEPLDPRRDLVNCHMTRFSWGIVGYSADQLALAILAHHIGGDGSEAIELHKAFKMAVIRRIPTHEDWTLTSDQIEEYINRLRG